MGVKDKKDGPISPMLFKFGVALAFSLGGIVFTFLRSKRIMLPKPKSSPPSPGKGSQAGSDIGADHHENLSMPRAPLLSSVSEASSSDDRSFGDRDGFLLHELDELVKEYDMAKDDVSQRKDGHLPEPNSEPTEEYERELRSLRSKVEILEERERILENQLLEYYGLKEQEKAMSELQNRLRIHNMEAKLYNNKIESLQLDNKRLQAKVADYEKVVSELESAEAKIKLLRKKLRFEAEQNRVQILRLQERVMKMQDQEKNPVETNRDADTQLHSQERRRLEEELEEMKRYNHSLKLENLELAQKVDNLQILAKSALDDKEVQALKEESQLLRQENESFRNEVDQLQADRCTDVEELVYLRWINACLRYELRNYQPGPDETVARDLSKTLSPKSEEKAKKLILAYANREGCNGKDPSISDFYFDEWSISQSSYLTDSGEPDDLPTDNFHESKTSHRNKKRVFAKLMKLLRGKDNDHRIQTTPSSPRERAASIDDALSRCSVSGIDVGGDGHTKTATTSSAASSRQSFDQRNATAESSRRMSDDVALNIFRSFDSISGYDDYSPSGLQPGKEAQSAAKNDLVKYAEALKNSRPRPSFRRRSVSFGSF